MTLLHDDTPERVLAIYAHPDDPEISAGGTLAKWAGAGCEVWLLITARDLVTKKLTLRDYPVVKLS